MSVRMMSDWCRADEPLNSSHLIPRSSLFVSFPIARASDGFEPAPVQSFALARAHTRLVGARDAQARGDVVTALPEADGESRKVGRARGGRLRHFGHKDARAEDVGLELH